MNDFDYVAWSLLVAGTFALLVIILGRRTGKLQFTPLDRRRDKLELELGDRLALHRRAEAEKIQDTIARLDAFAARHPALGNVLTVLDRTHLTIGILGMGFVTVALVVGKLGTGGGRWSPFAFLAPYYLAGAVIESIPPYSTQWRGALFMGGLFAAFAVPLAIVNWWVP